MASCARQSGEQIDRSHAAALADEAPLRKRREPHIIGEHERIKK